MSRTILVLGSGVAGLTAAISARENGADTVVILESEDVVGGSTRLSGGMMVGAGHRFQRAAGIADSADQFFSDYMNLNGWNLNAEAARVFTEQAGPALDWLHDLGVPFHPEPVFSGPEFVPRAVAVRGHGQGLIDALRRHATRIGVDIALNHRVDGLGVEHGRVVGVRVGQETIDAAAVVVATGGFGANPEKLAEHFPRSSSGGDWTWYMGAESARGDALDLAESIGAGLCGHDRGLRMLHPDFIHAHESYLPGWLVLVDPEGERFVDETAPYGIVDHLVRLHHDKAYVIFDHRALDLADFRSSPAYKQTIPGRDDLYNSPNWNPSMIEAQIAAGAVKRADSIGSLADALGLPPARLESTIRRYNDGHTEGRDACGKHPRFIRPVTRPPFYGAEVRPATIALTSKGLAVDGSAAVLDRGGCRIGGLYAAGECTGGIVGDVYLGGGNSLSNGAAFGRIAGKSAARHLDADRLRA